MVPPMADNYRQKWKKKLKAHLAAQHREYTFKKATFLRALVHHGNNPSSQVVLGSDEQSESTVVEMERAPLELSPPSDGDYINEVNTYSDVGDAASSQRIRISKTSSKVPFI